MQLRTALPLRPACFPSRAAAGRWSSTSSAKEGRDVKYRLNFARSSSKIFFWPRQVVLEATWLHHRISLQPNKEHIKNTLFRLVPVQYVCTFFGIKAAAAAATPAMPGTLAMLDELQRNRTCLLQDGVGGTAR